MMLIRRNLFNRLISLMLVVSILLMTVGCSNAPPTPTISDANPQTVTESVEIENIITENELHEFITTEIYLEEIVLAENKISELLFEEETITEVMCCKTIYVPQEHIEDFAENSQTTHLFGEGINIKSVLTKVAVGTGVIVTVVVLKKAGLPDPIASAVVAPKIASKVAKRPLMPSVSEIRASNKVLIDTFLKSGEDVSPEIKAVLKNARRQPISFENVKNTEFL